MASSGKTPNTGNQGSSMSQQGQQKADDLKNRAQEAGQSAMETASSTLQRAQDVASGAIHRAQDFASTAAERTRDAMSTVGEQMSSLAGTIRERAPQQGPLGNAASTVADSLEASGHYLQEHELADLAADVGSLISRYPVQSVLAGLGIGFLLGRTFSRR